MTNGAFKGTEKEKPKVEWTHFVIGAVLLLGVLLPAVAWLSRLLWSQVLRGLW